MEELLLDIEDMVKPSWVTSVPTRTTGKMKADQWRILGSIYLPSSLIRLWSGMQPDDPRAARCQELLDVTMSLVSAIVIASSRSTSPTNAQEYLLHMTEYRKGLENLFPTYVCHPNHHMAMHLHEFLVSYGPAHGWWTFALERLIGMLQRIPTNYKPGKVSSPFVRTLLTVNISGEYEETTGRSFVRSANLRALTLKDSPQPLQQCKAMFESLVAPEVRNTLKADIHSQAVEVEDTDREQVTSTAAKPLPPALRSAITSAGHIAPHRAKLLSHLTVRGVRYSVRSKHEGNSGILLEDVDNNSIAVCIEHMGQFTSLFDDTNQLMFGLIHSFDSLS